MKQLYILAASLLITVGASAQSAPLTGTVSFTAEYTLPPPGMGSSAKTFRIYGIYNGTTPYDFTNGGAVAAGSISNFTFAFSYPRSKAPAFTSQATLNAFTATVTSNIVLNPAYFGTGIVADTRGNLSVGPGTVAQADASTTLATTVAVTAPVANPPAFPINTRVLLATVTLPATTPPSAFNIFDLTLIDGALNRFGTLGAPVYAWSINFNGTTAERDAAIFTQTPNNPATSTGGTFPPMNGGIPTLQSTMAFDFTLPLDLISFDASKASSASTRLDWKTQNEMGTSHFVVERSADGKRFTTTVGQEKAAGNSTALLAYTMYDRAPIIGDNYYRLKMVDLDGSYEYSQIRKVNFTSAAGSDVAVIPNPFQNSTAVRILADQAQIARYFVTDAAGRTVRSGTWELQAGTQEFALPLGDAATGMYLLSVQGSSVLAELKMVKTN